VMQVRPHLHADQTTSADSRRPKKSAGGAVRVKLKPMKGLPLDVDNTEVTSSRSRPSSSPSLQDRLSMLVTEANEISKYLQRDYVGLTWRLTCSKLLVPGYRIIRVECCIVGSSVEPCCWLRRTVAHLPTIHSCTLRCIVLLVPPKHFVCRVHV
jgi:hypothetical protein